jgi:hypothetical protein
MSDLITESRMVLAVQEIRKNLKLTVLNVCRIYDVPRITLRRRFDGKYVRRDSMSNSRKLSDIEEKCILHYIFELVDQRYPPRFEDV